MKTRKLTFSAILTAICIAAGNIIFIPVGAAKCFPVQHLVNVVAAVALGPGYAVAMAFCVSLVRNIMGTGTLLAFPGSMIGALLAGLAYKYSGKKFFAVIGEVTGTGIIGGIASYPIAAYIMGKNVALFFYVTPFLISTVGGSILAYIILKALEPTRILDFNRGL